MAMISNNLFKQITITLLRYGEIIVELLLHLHLKNSYNRNVWLRISLPCRA